MAVSNMLPMQVMAKDELAIDQNTIATQKKSESTKKEVKIGENKNVISGFTGKNMVEEDGKVTMGNQKEDNFAMYEGLEKPADDFHFSADVVLAAEEGSWHNAALLFGVQDKANPGANWKAANVVKEDMHTDDQMRVFRVPEVIDYGGNPKQLEGYDETKKVHLDLDVQKDGTFVYTVQSEGGTLNTKTGKMDDWQGGYIGLANLRTTTEFTNIQFENRTITGISGFSGTGVTEENGNITLAKSDRDNFAFYDGLTEAAKDFHFSGDVVMSEGGLNNATLLFGVKDKSNTDKGWKGANVVKEPSHLPDRMRVFTVPGGHDYVDQKELEGYDVTKKIHLDLDVKANGNFVYTVQSENGTLNKQTGKMNDWEGGYIGLLTLKTEAVFSNVQFENRTVKNPLTSKLDNLRGLNGLWENRDGAIYSKGDGDNFAISDTKVKDFEYSANIKNEENKGAGALMFRVQNPAKPKDGSYIVNIDYSNKVIKMFEFPSGNTIKEVPLSDVEAKADGSYDLKVTMVGEDVVISANGKGIMYMKSKSLKDGYLGLLTWNGAATYKDIEYKETQTLPEVDKAELTGFEIQTKGVTITPKFDKDVRDYGMDIPAGTGDVVLKPTSKGNIFVTLKTRGGSEIIKEKTEVTDTIVIKPEDFDVNFLNMVITVENGTFSESINFAVNQWISTDELANQPYRSQFHVTPQVNFMNDPNGLVYDPTDGYWHMHYQYSPKNDFYKQSWAHVRSKDLVNWEQMPLSIQIDEIGVIFSGSAIALTEEEGKNPNILEGVFKDNKPGESRLVSFFTYDKGRGYETQSLAYSKDHGTTWQRIGRNVIENPHITPGNPKYGIDFRDPKVFKVPGDDTRWYMTVAGGEARVFVSENLVDWEESQVNLFDINGKIIASECPGLNPVTIEGTDITKWVYNGSDGFYIVGDMVKDEVTGIYKWVAESAAIENDSNGNPWAGTGKYANMTFYEDGTGQGRHIGVSWLQDNGSANFEGKTYWGLQTLPFEWKLKQRENGEYVVINQLVEEVEKLRDMDNVLYRATNKKVTEKDGNILRGISGIRYDLEGVFTLGTAKEFGFKLRKGNGQEVVYRYDVESKKMFLDLGKAGYSRGGNYSYDLVPLAGNKVKLRVIIDQGAIEAFGNDGEAALSAACYTNNDNIGMEFYTAGGDVTIDSLNIYDMKSMYSGKSGSESGDAKLFLSVSNKVELDKEFTVETNIYPNLSSDQKIKWSYDDGLSEVRKENGSITLKAATAGTYKIKGTTEDGALSKEITVEVKPDIETNIAWPTDTSAWEVLQYGIEGKNTGGDNFLMSDQKIYANKPFVLETNIEIENGVAAGVVFGVANKDNVTSHWFCANITPATNKTKLFKNQGGRETILIDNTDIPPAKTKAAKRNYNLKIEYDGNGTLKYSIDGVEIKTVANIGITDGYVGVQTYNAAATFDKVQLAFPDATPTGIKDTVADITVEYKANKEDVIAMLPKKVEISYDNGSALLEAITWNTDALNTDKAGIYELTGTSGKFTTKVKIIVDANKASLQDTYDAFKDYEETNYTKSSWTAFKTALDDAKLKLDTTATQKEVDDAQIALVKAEKNLVAPANKAGLAAALESAKKITSEGYTKESYEALQSAIQAAERVFVDEDAVDADVKAQVSALLDAITNLKTEGDAPIVVDKSELEAAVAAASKKENTGYTADSWKIFTDTLENAKEILAKASATQREVLDALVALQTAEAGLRIEGVTPGVDPEDKEDNQEKEDKEDAGVNTGDTTNLGVLSGMMVVSAVAYAATKKAKKKSNSK